MEESILLQVLQVRTGKTLHTAGSILTRDISLTHCLRRDFFPQIEIRRPLPHCTVLYSHCISTKYHVEDCVKISRS